MSIVVNMSGKTIVSGYVAVDAFLSGKKENGGCSISTNLKMVQSFHA